MQIQKVLIGMLIGAGIAGIAWSGYEIVFQKADTRSVAPIVNTPEDYATAVSSELSDKCQTPPGYTQEGWEDHLSHHPDRYEECL